MNTPLLRELVEGLRARNREAYKRYRELALCGANRSVSSLAAAAAEQRRDWETELEKTLRALTTASPETPAAGSVTGPAHEQIPGLPRQTGACDAIQELEMMRDTERGDEELLLRAVEAAEGERLADELRSWAEMSGKRAARAQDQLELLELSR